MATSLSLAIIGAIYALSAWAMSVATGPANLVPTLGGMADPTAFIFDQAGTRLASVFVDIGTVLFVTSVLAAAISFHNTVARYTFALGRERVFPVALGSTGRRSGAPLGGSILQSLIGLVVIILVLVFGLDPVLHLFFYGGNGGGFGIMLMVTLTSLAVIFFFARNNRGESVLARVIAPAISFVLLGVVVYFAVDGFGNLLAPPPGSPEKFFTAADYASWIIPALYPVVGLLGVIYALILKSVRPEVYQAIGLGANTTTGLATASRVEIPTGAAVRS
jgi:amino acid transporter